MTNESSVGRFIQQLQGQKAIVIVSAFSIKNGKSNNLSKTDERRRFVNAAGFGCTSCIGEYTETVDGKDVEVKDELFTIVTADTGWEKELKTLIAGFGVKYRQDSVFSLIRMAMLNGWRQVLTLLLVRLVRS